jgi:hypothetical protein
VLPQHEVDILILCEHTLFCISDAGEIRMQKRLGAR